MASTAVPPVPHLNGTSMIPEALRETDRFLDNFLQLRDEVLTGRHPRIKLPPAVIEQFGSRHTTHAVTAPQPSSPKPTASQARLPQTLPARPANAAPQFPPAPDNRAAVPAERPLPVKPPLSGIDPVLLTKSDHLIRAELQLKRQHIERSLKDQADKRGRVNEPLAEEGDAYIDIESALAKAQAMVPPVSGLPSLAQNSEDNTSFDENSYYSSQASSWSPDRTEPSLTGENANADEGPPSQAQLPATEAQLTAATASAPAHAPPTRVEPTVIDLDEEPYEPAEDIEPYEPELPRDVDEQDESDYSPPPAAAGPSQPTRGRQRGRGGRKSGNGSRRQSPSGNPPALHVSRKRRREERRDDRSRQQVETRVARSPEPYIKQEPQSPTMLASYPDAQPSKRRALPAFPADEYVTTPGSNRMRPIQYVEHGESPRSYRLYEEPSPTVMHVPQRRAERGDHDLRRVASLQSLRRPVSPGFVEPYQPVEVRSSRAASYAYIERPTETVYRGVSAHPSAAPRYIRDSSRSPVQEYLPRAHSPVQMAPHPRRIVEDEFGNRYYAAPVVVRESVAPVRMVEAAPRYEGAVTRETTVRAPARVEMYDGEDVMRMPPPPPRRYIEVADGEVSGGRPYAVRESSHRPVDVGYAARGAVERVARYADMGPPTREYVAPRAYSVRPDVVRRDMADDYAPVHHERVAAPRFASVAAPRREHSIVRQEQPYVMGPPMHGRRYMEELGNEGPGELVPMERPVEPGHEYGGEPRRVYRY
ncbi:hypothetical protein M011DRAFT_401727 [Sporormia fimetaria CBS 119925]|uniref:Uncharacterized protein n=1 Tax=Sporormia fimetaria CBS 119925 TaxID=1340428 RepID=A0A6A6VDK6_9PLEO|nr:hypothetical protein M011DRAFT_401727 [Sporormia fimetaria CBS 119925]